MFDFLKRKKAPDSETASVATPVESVSLFTRLKQGLTKTRTSLASGLANLFLGKKTLDNYHMPFVLI